MALFLVTGGAGFIGSNLVQALVERGDSVRVLDDYSTGKPENLASVADRIEIVEGSVTDEPTVRRAMQDVEFVLHEGALASVPRSVEDPLGSNVANVTGTLAVLLAARDAHVRRLVYAASSSAYGDQPALPKTEAMAPSPLSPYAVSKLAGEYYCQAFTECYGLETVALRYFNVYGPQQSPQSVYAAVIPKLITAMLAGERPTIFGDGEQSRDFTYVADVVAANVLACTAPDAVGQALNVACGQRYSLNDLVAALNRILGTDIAPIHAAARAGDVKHSLADISAARTLLGYEPQFAFEDGLRRTVAWFQAK
ncbi:MAG: SDR family oxidoreductase [Candidatus Brocadiae bacterium]|nr:SDR family oxidoreductase [Candidatus Brocadiia bacterium]